MKGARIRSTCKCTYTSHAPQAIRDAPVVTVTWVSPWLITFYAPGRDLIHQFMSDMALLETVINPSKFLLLIFKAKNFSILSVL